MASPSHAWNTCVCRCVCVCAYVCRLCRERLLLPSVRGDEKQGWRFKVGRHTKTTRNIRKVSRNMPSNSPQVVALLSATRVGMHPCRAWCALSRSPPLFSFFFLFIWVWFCCVKNILSLLGDMCSAVSAVCVCTINRNVTVICNLCSSMEGSTNKEEVRYLDGACSWCHRVESPCVSTLTREYPCITSHTHTHIAVWTEYLAEITAPQLFSFVCCSTRATSDVFVVCATCLVPVPSKDTHSACFPMVVVDPEHGYRLWEKCYGSVLPPRRKRGRQQVLPPFPLLDPHIRVHVHTHTHTHTHVSMQMACA